MGSGTLNIDLGAIVANWRALDALSAPTVRTGAVVKANAYGLGVDAVCKALARAGARIFFVAIAEEGAAVRRALGPEVDICVFSGHMEGDAPLLRQHRLTPMLNSVEQLTRHVETLGDHPFGVQLDTGMNRLGMEAPEWLAVRDIVMPMRPVLVMSHLACSDEPDDPANEHQLRAFREMTDGLNVPRSLSATGGILLGPDFHFDVARPGIGLYGGLPFEHARPVVSLDLPVVQVRDVAPDEIVGYGATWRASRPTRIATLSGGYADGLIRAMGARGVVYAGTRPCALAGRVSMDLLTVDVSDLPQTPESMQILGSHQGIDQLAEAAGTIGYEILTSLGSRYARRHVNGSA